ncbi:Pentatricopeptide repeat-containing protein At5g16860 [Linum grandiflorum]
MNPSPKLFFIPLIRRSQSQLFSSSSSSSSSAPLLDSCQSIQLLKQIHAHAIIVSGFLSQPNCFPASKFISLYSTFGCLRYALFVFDALIRPDTLSWNAIIKAHVDSGLGSQALLLYRKMRQFGAQHDGFTFPIVSKAVTLAFEHNKVESMVHCVAFKLGFASDLYFCNTMIEVYAKCGLVFNALKLFDEMPLRDLVSWTSVITAYISQGDVSHAFELFSQMRMEMEPNSVTFIVMLQSCNWTEGMQLQGYLVKNGLFTDVSLQNSLLRLYGKTGCVDMVENLFSEMSQKDVVSWNILINLFSLTEDYGKVASVFNQMHQLEVAVSSETLTSVITMLGKSLNLTEGEKLHSLAVKVGLNDNVLMTSFLDFYAKCGKLSNSTTLFREMSCKSSITWNAMMSGFIQHGFSQEALQIFRQMQAVVGVQLGAETLGSLVDACAQMGTFHLGKEIHGYLIKNLFSDQYLSLTTCILNMYIRCGRISSAREVFNRMEPITRDIVAWTSMIDGYGVHGLGNEAINLLDEMLEEGLVTPNAVTFLSLLASCSHSGLVREGCEIFVAAKHVHGVELSLDHYTCLVDLLGRSGKLKEALVVVLKMGNVYVCGGDGRIWGALLAAARSYDDRKIGEYAAAKVLEVEPDGVGYYTLLSNVRAGGGEWDEAERVRRVVHEKELKKEPGWSVVEGRENHRFVAGDVSHVRREEIREVLRHLSSQVINESEYTMHLEG